MLRSFERLFGWLSKLFIRLFCIKYCGVGIFQYLFNINTSVGLRFSRILSALSYTFSLIVKCIADETPGFFCTFVLCTELLRDLCITLCSRSYILGHPCLPSLISTFDSDEPFIR